MAKSNKARLKIEPMKQPDKIINYWLKEKFVVACIIIFGLTFNISAVLGPIWQGKLIDSVAGGDELNVVIRLAAIFISIIMAIQLLRYFKRFFIRRFANSVSAEMRLMIYNNIIHKSASELDNENTGNLMTRAVSDVELCVEGMRKFTTEIFDTGVLMATYAVSMFFYDLKITLVSIIFVPAAMFIAERLKAYIYEYSASYRHKSSEVADITYNMIENFTLFRLSGMEPQNREMYDSQLEDLQKKAIKANILENSMQPIYNAVAMLGVIFVIYMGGSKVLSEGWTIGDFSAYISIFTALAVKAGKGAKLFNSVQKSQVSWKRIKPYLAEYRSKSTESSLYNESISLTVKNLCFRYDANRDNIIQNISFEGKQGQIIGVTGSVASGKSTLAVSLLGLYPYQGSILINGKELSNYSDYERSMMISYSGHDPQLLSDSIYNNIVLGKTSDITNILSDVCFADDMKRMPDGINTQAGSTGIRLSGGQQARVAIARALFNRNKIIILDDPFSAVDMKTEEKIIENIRKNYKECLIILVSHRLAIFDKVDSIILLENDKSAKYGTHDELMKCSDVYATIYNLQSAKEVDYNEA